MELVKRYFETAVCTYLVHKGECYKYFNIRPTKKNQILKNITLSNDGLRNSKGSYNMELKER